GVAAWHISPEAASRCAATAVPKRSEYQAVQAISATIPPPMPSRRFFLPAPAASPGETRRQRWRRKRRTNVLRWFDRTILSLYRLIAWLDRRAPLEKRYFRVAIFGSSRIQPEGEVYAQVRELARQLSYMGCDIVTGGGPGL